MTKKRTKKHLLDEHVYVVEERARGNVVHKVPAPDTDEKTVFYNIDEDGECQCKAAEFGNTCKHQLMVAGTLTKAPMPLGEAEKILEDYLDKLRAQWPRAQIVSLLQYKRGGQVGSAAALACGVLAGHEAEKITVWSEFGPLLVRIYCFKERDRYRRALRAVRDRWQKEKGGAPADVGQTSDTQAESESE